MEARELRIGNKVMVNGKIVVIESIDDQGINSSVSWGYYPGDTEIEYDAYFKGRNYPEPNPIPLSPELLEKCGFVKTDYNGQEHWLGPKIERVQPFSTFQLGILYNPTIGYYYTTEVSSIIFQSLHQFTNWYFALTGSEIEIKTI